MCLGVPARVVDVDEQAALRAGTVDFGGVRRQVCLACVPDAVDGDWVIVHAGIAIARLDTDAAAERLALLDAATSGPTAPGGPPVPGRPPAFPPAAEA